MELYKRCSGSDTPAAVAGVFAVLVFVLFVVLEVMLPLLGVTVRVSILFSWWRDRFLGLPQGVHVPK